MKKPKLQLAKTNRLKTLTRQDLSKANGGGSLPDLLGRIPPNIIGGTDE